MTTSSTPAPEPSGVSTGSAEGQMPYVVPLLVSLVLLAIVFASWWKVGREPSSCRHLQPGASFAGSTDRFNDFVNDVGHTGGGCAGAPLEAARSALWLGIATATATGLTLFFLLAWWIRRAAFTRRALVWVWRLSFLPLVAAGCDVLENLLTLAGLHKVTTAGGPEIRLRNWAAGVLPVVAWPKLVFFAVAIGALMVTWISARDAPAAILSASTGPHRGAKGPLGRVCAFLNAHWHLLEEVATDRQSPGPCTPAFSHPAGLGISCSGGGIRAAAVAMGVLSSLESHEKDGKSIPPGAFDGRRSYLDRAKYLSSVSGGGYTAAAWRIARGSGTVPDGSHNPEPDWPTTWPSGLIGSPWLDPESTPDPPPPEAYDSDVAPGDPTLYRHVRARHQYLRTGRGGLAWSSLRALGYLTLQLALLGITIALVAWPVGRLSRTWYVYGGIGCRSFASGVAAPVKPHAHGDLGKDVCGLTHGKRDACSTPSDDPALEHSLTRARCFLQRPGVQMPIKRSLLAAPVVLGGLAIAFFAPTLGELKTRSRRALRLVSLALAGVSSALALLLLGLPLLLDVAYPYVSTPLGVGLLSSALSAGGVTAIVLRIARQQLTRRIDLLGKLLVALAAVLFGILVGGQGAINHGVFALPMRGLAGGFLGWGVLAVVVIFAYTTLDPRVWSLHIIYRNRLRSTFSTTRNAYDARNSAIKRDMMRGQPRILPLRGSHEPTLDRYPVDGTRGPQHLVCCSAARRTKAVTGIAALSFVFGPEEVAVYVPEYQGKSVVVRAFSVPTSDYVGAIPARTQHATATESAAIAMSAAAVASSMGRFNTREPTSLFAALNLRLGVWMPHPKLVRPEATRKPRVRLSYLLKEIAGYFEFDDRHLYITDGGHRENLGLVELLRRRCKTIVCIDGSGDKPGTYTTLRQAAQTALVEIDAHINLAPLDPKTNDEPPPKPGEPRLHSFTRLEVTYDYRSNTAKQNEKQGWIIYIPAEMFVDCPVALLAFADEDTEFPHYSTGNQLLSDAQFVNLVKFGWAACDAMLTDHEARTTIDAAI